MKYSILIALHDPENKVTGMTKACIDSIERNSKDYELLVLQGDGHRKVSYTNELWKQAIGEYLILVGNDVIIDDKNWLEKLAIPDTITSAWIHPNHFNHEPFIDFALCCVPRNVLDKVGYLDEQFADGYGYDDNDWSHRARLLNIPQVAITVRATHVESGTYNVYFTKEEKKKLQDRNWELYKLKWNL